MEITATVGLRRTSDLAQPDRGQHADLARGQHGGSAQHGLAARNVATGCRNRRTGGHRPAQLELVDAIGIRPHELGLLDHDHGIGATRQHAAGGDHRRRARAHRERRLQARGHDFRVDAQTAWCCVGSTRAVGGAQREAVHAGPIEARDIHRGEHILGQHALPGGAERDPFAGTGSKVEVAAQPGLRLVEPDDLQELLLPGRHGQGGAQIG